MSSKELGTQKQAEEEKNTKLQETVEAKEREYEELTAKLKTLTAQYNRLTGDQKRKRSKSEVHDSSMELVRAQSEEVLWVKQSMAKELSTLQTRLDTEMRHSIELDEQLIRLQKEKAKVEVEKTQLEKQLLSEKQLFHELEEQGAKHEETIFKLSGNNAGVRGPLSSSSLPHCSRCPFFSTSSLLKHISQVHQLAQEAAKLNQLVLESENKRLELEIETEELGQSIKTQTAELEIAKAV